MNQQKAVLITGASTGIGRQCALDLAINGYYVFAGVRKTYEPFPENLSIDVLPLDITDASQILEAVAYIENSLEQHHIKGLYALVNNAGIAVGGPLEFTPIQDLQRQFDINVFGQIACIQAFLPLLRDYGHYSKIINMSSIAGRSYSPFISPYCASKHALETFSDALRLELAPWKINVCLIEPGVIQTPIWDKASHSLHQLTSHYTKHVLDLYGEYLAFFEKYIERCSKRGIPASIVSKTVLSILTLQSPKHRYLLGTDAKRRALLQLLPTELLDKLILSYFSKQHERVSAIKTHS